MGAGQTIDGPANPLLGRVMVNRNWHHLFGRGIVPTVDNFGFGLVHTVIDILNKASLKAKIIACKLYLLSGRPIIAQTDAEFCYVQYCRIDDTLISYHVFN